MASWQLVATNIGFIGISKIDSKLLFNRINMHNSDIDSCGKLVI